MSQVNMSQAKKKLNIAMIGTGFIARAHSNAFRQVGHFFDTPYELELKALCGRNAEKREAMAGVWGWAETASDWQDVVGRPDIDIVDIATPNVLHAAIALEAARAGKMIFCEKPLAMSVEEAEAMAQATGNLPNLVWFNYRRVPAVALAKRMMEEGRLGRIYHYRAVYLNESGNNPAKAATWRYRREESGSGAMGDLLSHSLDLALYLNGPLTELTAMTHTFAEGRDVDDAAMLLARFKNGSVGTFEATRYGVGSRNRNTFEIHGEKGMLGFNLEDMNRLIYYDVTEAPNMRAARNLMVTGPDHPYAENFWKPGHTIGYEHTFIATLGDFLSALSRGEIFHPNFEDALAVQRLLSAVEKSATARRWISL
jgi:myo-inositol 2-dehydrogenase/D-chiro-inositol 1-dehydrogenase